MKKWFYSVMAAVLLIPSLANAAFEEGKHYTVVSEVATSNKEVMEFFSYFCGACFRFEPIIAQLKSNLPEDVRVKRAHVDFLGGEMGVELSKAFATAELLEVEAPFSEAVFKQIHVDKKYPQSRDDIAAIFTAVGVDAEKYHSSVDSFMVNGRHAQMQKALKDFGINATPTIVINGRYKLETGSVASIEEYMELVNYLLNK